MLRTLCTFKLFLLRIDPLCYRDLRDQFSNEVIGDLTYLLESDTALSPIEFFYVQFSVLFNKP